MATDSQELPDISHRAKWSVSSYKFGFGVECLRDGDPDTFWHSDGPQPHSITIEFPCKMAIQAGKRPSRLICRSLTYLFVPQQLSILLKFSQDDSYTPSTLAIRAGTGQSDLQEVKVMTFEKPEGWMSFDISNEINDDGQPAPVYAYVLHIVVAQNHMSGKDTHVRGLRVLGPIDENMGTDDGPFAFKGSQYKIYETLR